MTIQHTLDLGLDSPFEAVDWSRIFLLAVATVLPVDLSHERINNVSRHVSGEGALSL